MRDQATNNENAIHLARQRANRANNRDPLWRDVDYGRPDECWEWKGVDRFLEEARRETMSRFGLDPGDGEPDVTCGTDGCVNPSHLEQSSPGPIRNDRLPVADFPTITTDLDDPLWALRELGVTFMLTLDQTPGGRERLDSSSDGANDKPWK